MNGTDVFPQRPVFHTILPVRGFSQQKSPIIPADGYSMTPLWGPRPQSGTTAQPPPPYESQIDDDVVSSLFVYDVHALLTVSKRMDCDSTQRRSASPSALPPSSTDPTHSSSNPANAEEIPLRTPKLLANCPSLEMNEISPSVSQGPTSHIGRTIQPKRPRFTMGPRSDCEKCRAGVKGHWGHFT